MRLVMDANELSAAERQVWHAFPTGQVVDFGTSNAEEAPASSTDWDQNRQVHARVLADLLRGAVSAAPGHEGAVRIHGARIIGLLDLAETELHHSLTLVRCHVADGIELTAATARGVVLEECYLGAIRFTRANMNGDFSLRRATVVSGDVPALDGEGSTVNGDMLCDQARIEGEVCLAAASINQL
jgi:hypothetical protein